MYWTTTEIRKDHREQVSEMEILGVLQGNILYSVGVAKINIVTGRPYDVLDEFVIRCLIELAPCPGDSEIAKILGFDNTDYITPITNELATMGDLKSNDQGGRQVSRRLAESFINKRWLQLESEEVKFIYNPFANPPFKQEVVGIIQEPLLDFDIEPQQEILKNWLASQSGPLPDKIVEVKNVEFHGSCEEPVEVIIYLDHKDSTWDWEVYDTQRRQLNPQQREALMELDIQQGCEDYLRSVEEPESDLSVKEEPLALLETTLIPGLVIERMGTLAAQKKIETLLANSKKQVVLVFPWIKQPALDLIKAMTKAVNNGAHVYITYGIEEAPNLEYSFEDVIDRLNSISSNDNIRHVTVVWTGRMHIKECIFDRTHYMMGSLNRLSFKGDPDRYDGAVRREVMIYSNVPDLIEKSLDEHLPIIYENLIQNATSKSILSCKQWQKTWLPILAIRNDYKTYKSALSSVPEQLKEKLEIFNSIAQEQKKENIDPELIPILVDWCQEVIGDVKSTQNKNSIKPIIKTLVRNLKRVKDPSLFEDIIAGFEGAIKKK